MPGLLAGRVSLTPRNPWIFLAYQRVEISQGWPMQPFASSYSWLEAWVCVDCPS